MIVAYTPLQTLAGWLLDLIFGDPARLPHPVVGFGRWIAFWEHHLNHGQHRKVKGALMSIASIALVFVATWALLSSRWPMVNMLFSVVLIFFCIAGHTLRREVRLVFVALDRSLDDGRRQVSRIVGRDTAQLSAQEVRTAALETLAENLSDGVVAPLFWLVIAGVPGMMAYKMVNTLDSMIGYRTDRYRDFGCWAAHIDDAANYLPARITALFMLVAHRLCNWSSTYSFRRSLAFVRRYGPCHASPNSGWPEAALAACLDCRFGGTHDYFGQAFQKPYIGDNPRALTTADLHISLRLCFGTELLAVVFVVLIQLSVTFI